MMPRRHNEEAGSALLVVVVFMIIVSMFASGFIALVHTNLNASNRAAHRQVCAALAEGGIEKAAVSLRADSGYRGGPYFALGDGEVAIQIVPAEAAGHYVATSTARYSHQDPAPVSVTAELVLTPNGVRIVRWEEQRR